MILKLSSGAALQNQSRECLTRKTESSPSCGLRLGRGMAGSFWTPERDRRLQKLEAAGLSAEQMADRLGATRNAVIGRSVRLRGLVFRSQLQIAEEETARRLARRRDKRRRTDAALSVMRQLIAKRVPLAIAIAKAIEAGATYQAIGDELGVSRQRAHQIGCQKIAMRPKLPPVRISTVL
ncbi:MAG TPA: GcrA family cell cycle regulator [Xanthobacteraceae bacterium]